MFARDGEQALGRLAADPAIELMLLDINMPVMDGLTLLARLREMNAPVRAIISGRGNASRRGSCRAGRTAAEGAHRGINLRPSQPGSDCRAEQQVINSQARVASPRIPEVVPERVYPLAGVKRTQGIGPALRKKSPERLPHLGTE